MVYLLIVIILGGLYLSIQQVNSRYFKDYKKEIEGLLRTKRIDLRSIKSPKKEDWYNSPFPKEPIISINVITVNNQSVNHTKYKIIEVTEKDNIATYWVQIRLGYFQKPKFEYRKMVK